MRFYPQSPIQVKYADGDLNRIPVGNNELHANLFSKVHTYGMYVKFGAGNVNLTTLMIYDIHKKLCIESLTLHTVVKNP
jgi:hypothetical protein